MITGINESKTLTKHISCECKYIFDGKTCNLNQSWNNDKCRCVYKNPKSHMCEKDYICNPATSSCQNGKYLGGIIDDSVITRAEIVEEKGYSRKNRSNKKYFSFNKFQYFISLLLIAIALLIAKIYCHII